MAAQRSLEMEKALIRIKKESYKNDLDQFLMMKKHKEGHQDDIKKEMLRQDINNIEQYA